MSLGGGVNLTREPRNGRSFEYLGEDPILAGKMVGAVMKGLQAATQLCLAGRADGYRTMNALCNGTLAEESPTKTIKWPGSTFQSWVLIYQ